MRRPAFTVRHVLSRPDWLTVQFRTFSQDLFIPGSCDAYGASELTVERVGLKVLRAKNRVRLVRSYRSNLWHKTWYVDIYRDRIELFAELHGKNRIDTVRFFEGSMADGRAGTDVVEKIRHLNDHKRSDYRDWSTASPVGFSKLLNPEPNSYGKSYFESFEYSQISVNCDLDYCGGNFISNPGLLCYAVAKDETEWVSLGLAVTPGQYMFSEYEFVGGRVFGLNLNYWGVLKVKSTFRTPKLVIQTAASPEEVLRKYVRSLVNAKLVRLQPKKAAKWWSGPIICGWGRQCYQADLFRVRSPQDRPKDSAAYALCTQAEYEAFVAFIDSHALDWRTLIIDAKWYLSGGDKQIDTGRWPDMQGFVSRLHARGKRVLCWWGPWETEGLDPAECVVFSREASGDYRNRPGRLAKFLNGDANNMKIGPDITLPAVREKLRRRLVQLLSVGGNGMDVDGLKVDHVAATPGLYGLVFPPRSGRLCGIELLHYYQVFLYKTAKAIKPDCLIIGQSPNPYFADCVDMIRLGDVFSKTGRSVSSEMEFRAKMAKVANPHWLIDTDGWPMPSLDALREYAGRQVNLGVPSLYYSSHLDTTGERIEESFYNRVRDLWRQYLYDKGLAP